MSPRYLTFFPVIFVLEGAFPRRLSFVFERGLSLQRFPLGRNVLECATLDNTVHAHHTPFRNDTATDLAGILHFEQ